MSPERKILALARRQHGVITRAQAIDAGLTDRQLRHRISSGQWRKVRRGVFAVGASPATFEQAVLATVLTTPTPVWASRRTAARLYGLSCAYDTPIELVTRRSNQPHLAGVRVYRSLQLPAPDLGRWRGIPVTSPARTLVDLSSGLTVSQFGLLMDDAERRGLCSAASIARCVDRLWQARSRNLTTVRAALDLRVPGYGPGDSVLEQNALAALVNAGLPAPVRHHPVVFDGHQYEVDLAYPEWRIAIELLGFRYHGSRTAFDADSERTRRFVLHGWALLPFTSITPPSALVADVSRLIERAG